jgi:HAMP domain-containing protein
MDSALKALSANGIVGAILAVAFALLALTIGVLVWALKRYVESSIDEKRDFSEFMRALTASLNGLGLNFQATRTDTLSVVRDLGDRIEHVTWAAHDKMVLVFRESLTGTANSIRSSNEALAKDLENQRMRDELSRPHNITPAPGVVR